MRLFGIMEQQRLYSCITVRVKENMMRHNKEKNYYEYLAKLLLEQYIPDTYSGLQLADKPDLRMGDDYGIEVTRAMLPGEGQVSGVFEHIKMKPLIEAEQRKIKTIERLGYGLLVRDGIIIGYTPKSAFWVSSQELENSFLQKLEKSSHYEGFCSIDLFIFSPVFDWHEKDMINEFMMWADERNNGCFSKILVYEEKYIYSYNTRNKQFRTIPIDKSVLHSCCVKAKQFALGEYN